MKKKSILLVLFAVLLVFSGCGKSNPSDGRITVEADETFFVTVSMKDSGNIKSMALSVYLDDSAFELLEGEWLNQDAVIADFNKENKDAAIAFEKDTVYCGEIFRFSVKAKKDLTIIDDMIIVEPILKNEQVTFECKGIELAYSK